MWAAVYSLAVAAVFLGYGQSGQAGCWTKLGKTIDATLLVWQGRVLTSRGKEQLQRRCDAMRSRSRTATAEEVQVGVFTRESTAHNPL